MKLLKLMLALVSIILLSCNTDDDGSQDALPEQGNISLALSNGGGFVVENLEATVSSLYDTSITKVITLTGTAGINGNVVITIVDNDDLFMAVINENEIPIGDTSLPIYATVNYQSENFNLNAGAGTLEILNYEEFSDQNYASFSATFSAADSNFNTITSSILDLVLTCQSC